MRELGVGLADGGLADGGLADGSLYWHCVCVCCLLQSNQRLKITKTRPQMLLFSEPAICTKNVMNKATTSG